MLTTMQSSLIVEEPAEFINLITLEDAKLALNLAKSTDKITDAQIQMFVEWSSDEISEICNGRVFAKEKVTETFDYEVENNTRIFLDRWPVLVSDLVSVTENGTGLVIDVDFKVDSENGKLIRIGRFWSGTVVVVYSGGYALPNDSPPALRQATLLMVREARNAALRGDSTIRSVSHKESRVMYFDPTAKMGGGSGGGSPARRAIEDLLKSYTRFWA